MGRRPVVRRLRDPRLPDPAVLHLPGPRLRRTRHSTVSLAAAELRQSDRASLTRAVPSPGSKWSPRPAASEVEAAGDTSVAENRPDPGSRGRIKIYEIERYHRLRADNRLKPPDDDVWVPSPKL